MRPFSDLVLVAKRFPEELQKAQIRGVQKAALVTTRSIRDQIRVDTGGDMTMSHAGRRGGPRKINAYYNVKGKVNPTAIIRARGPLQLLDRSTRPHTIRPRKGGRGRQAKRALKFDGQFAAAVHHPGTRGKGTWDKGLRKAMPKTRRIFEDEIHKGVLRAVR